MRDALRLSVGTLTRIRVPPPAQVDARTAAGAMLIAPLVSALLGLAVGFVAQALTAWTRAASAPLLVAALSVAALAYLTRGLHLDGLADTADALGSGKGADGALAIARRSDIGPFGVVVIVLTLTVQIAALAGIVAAGQVALMLAVAVGSSRLTLAVACLRGIPAARPDGLGAAVAGSVPVAAAMGAIVGWTALCAAATALVEPSLLPAVLASILGALAVGAAVVVVCTRRLGGITGDVLGAVVEIALAASLVILVVIPT
jgi:adenosylcobinamide-GDP ribazoletransferase